MEKNYIEEKKWCLLILGIDTRRLERGLAKS
jgi:hypothetical protein